MFMADLLSQYNCIEMSTFILGSSMCFLSNEAKGMNELHESLAHEGRKT